MFITCHVIEINIKFEYKLLLVLIINANKENKRRLYTTRKQNS